MPHGNGQHFIILTKEIRESAKIKVGDTITVSLTIDNEVEVVTAPDDLITALKKYKTAFEYFNKLAPSHKKEYIKWLDETKKIETRENRISKAIEKLNLGQRLK